MCDVTGHMTDCPAYLSVTVNDRTAGEELCRYDCLVSCPPQFNITINVPPTPPSAITSHQRLFEVVLHDSKTEQRVFLTSIVVLDGEANKQFPLGENRATTHAGYTSRSLAIFDYFFSVVPAV